MAIRFHLDEHIDPALATGLRRRGIEVTTTVEAGLRTATDLEQLTYAVDQDRVLVTSDTDFLRLHQQGVHHAGIVFSDHGLRSLGEFLRLLVLLDQCLSAEEMRNHIEFL